MKNMLILIMVAVFAMLGCGFSCYNLGTIAGEKSCRELVASQDTLIAAQASQIAAQDALIAAQNDNIEALRSFAP